MIAGVLETIGGPVIALHAREISVAVILVIDLGDGTVFALRGLGGQLTSLAIVIIGDGSVSIGLSVVLVVLIVRESSCVSRIVSLADLIAISIMLSMGYEILAIPRCEEGVVLLAGGVISEGNLGVLVRGDLTDTLVLVEGIAIAVSALIGSLGDISILTIGDVGCLAIVTDELGQTLLLGVAVTLAEVIAVELDGIDIAGIASIGRNLDNDLVVLVFGDDAPSQNLPLLEVGIELEAVILRITILVVEGYSRSELIILSSQSMTEESEDKLVSSIAGHVDGLSSCIFN